MPYFKYKAVDQFGKSSLGQMEARNEVDLEIRLKQMGLDLITLHVAENARNFFSNKKVNQQDLMMFCFQMEQLSRAGLPMLECLQEIRESSHSLIMQKVLGEIHAEVEGGKLLSQALKKHPNIFNPVLVSLVYTGEQTGQLPDVFNQLFHTLCWQNELLSQTKKLLVYPIFVAVVVCAATAFLMSYLVPQMATLLRNMGQELPLNTKILIGLSNIFVSYWWLFVFLPVLVLVTLMGMIKAIPSMRYRFDLFKLNLPYIGEIFRKIIMARFARYFALMYQTGIPILDAIKTSEEIVGNRVIAEAVGRAHAQIVAGDTMSESFRHVGLFPSLVIRMIKIGETTGELDKSLMNISYFYDRDVNDSVQKMLKMLEPTLTILLGCILGFIMYSVLGPVYDSLNKFNI